MRWDTTTFDKATKEKGVGDILAGPDLSDEQRTDGVQPLVELLAVQRLQHDVLVRRRYDNAGVRLEKTAWRHVDDIALLAAD